MNRSQFFRELIKLIDELPEEEKEDILIYYNQYFDDAGEENESKVIEELGTPKEVADKIFADYNSKSFDKQSITQKNKFPLWAIILIAVFAIPVGLPIAIALFSIVFALIISLFAILLAFFATAAALFLSGVIIFVFSFALMFQHFPTALMLLGGSLILLGISILIYLGVYILTKNLINFIIKKIKNRGKKNEK